MTRYLVIFFACFIATIANQLHAADVYIPKSQIVEDTEPNYYIISIGVNNYLDKYWQTLKWPASDATRIADSLGTNTKIKRTTRLIINETATLENVNKSLLDVSQQAGPNDTVILYISGHGTLAQNESGKLERIFLLHDSIQQDLFSTALPYSNLQRWLDKLNSRKNLMILATCHAGEGKSRLPESIQQILSTRKGKRITLSDVSEGALVLTAAANGEAARENDKLQGDIYTYYFLEALNVHDRNKDGVISALEAHDYARDRTWIFTNGLQRPTANVKLIGDADIPLLGTKINDGLPVLEAYSRDFAGFFVKIDGKIKGRLPSAFPLNPKGSYVQLLAPQGNKPIARYRVKADVGQRLSLQQVISHRPLRIGNAIKRYYWSDDFWRQLTGGSEINTLEASASYYRGPYGIGAILEVPADKSNDYNAFINSTVELQSSFLVGEYRFRSFKWSFISRLELGREILSVELLDTSTNTTPANVKLKFTDTATSYGVSFSTEYKILSDFFVSASIGFRDADWGLGSLKDISGQRRWFSVGLNYQFGWTARTL